MYISYTEYVKTVKNPKVGFECFDMVELYAEAVISSFTFGVIERDRLLDDSAYGDLIRKATALQIDFMSSQGVEAYVDESGRKVSSRSVSVGGTSESVAYAEDKSAKAGGGMRVCPMSAAILAPVRAMGRVMR